MKHLVVGGTGSLGRALTRELLKDEANTVLCLSRDELKQKDTAREFGYHPRLSFALGDIRDRDALHMAMRGVHSVFHVAALKHVDTAEVNPEEAVKTNVLGTINVAEAATTMGVEYVMFSSTDKAVDPCTAYGYTKALSERILLNRNRPDCFTKFSVYRWANVLGSRGSFIHALAKSLQEERVVRITDLNMTRFWIRLEDAAQFVLATYRDAPSDAVLIPPIVKAAPLLAVVRVTAWLLGVKDYETVVIGTRGVEKIHEALISQHDPGHVNSSTSAQYTDGELAAMISEVLGLPFQSEAACGAS